MAKCLEGKPADNELDDTFLGGRLPGKIWSVDDQCKQYYGKFSYFDRVLKR